MALASGGFKKTVGGTNSGSSLSSRPSSNVILGGSGSSGGGYNGGGGVNSLIDALDENKRKKQTGPVGVSEQGGTAGTLGPDQIYYGQPIGVTENSTSSGAYSRPVVPQPVNQAQGLGNQMIGGLGSAIDNADLSNLGPVAAAPTPYTYNPNGYTGFNPGQNVQTLYRGGGGYGAGGFDTSGTAINARRNPSAVGVNPAVTPSGGQWSQAPEPAQMPVTMIAGMGGPRMSQQSGQSGINDILNVLNGGGI